MFALLNPVSAGLSRIMPRARAKRGDADQFTESVDNWEQRWRAVIPALVFAWITGENIATIGQSLHARRGADGKVNAVHLGRRFALQAAASIAHSASVVVRIVETVRGDAMSARLKRQLPLISGCIREGFDDPDKLLLFWQLRRFGGRYPRVAVHGEFVGLQDKLPYWVDGIDVDARREHIRRAWGAG